LIIQDEGSLEEALQLVEMGPVRYSDRYSWTVMSTSGALKKSGMAALERGEIAIVAPVGQEKTMEEYNPTVRKVLAQRKRDEMKKVRAWVSEHPEVKEAKTEQDILRIYRKVQKGELGS